jgi:signal transduction histidine kinase
MRQSLQHRPCAALPASPVAAGPVAPARRRAWRRRLDAGRLAAALLGAGLIALPAAAQVMTIHKLEWSVVAQEAGTPAASDAGAAAAGAASPGTPFDLPLRWNAVAGSPLRSVALRMHFPLAQVPTETWAIYVAHASEGGHYSINGHFIGAIPGESDARHVAWRRPQLLAIDPSLLRTGDNEVLVQTTFGPGAHELSGVEVGEQSDLWNRYARQLFLSYGWNWAGSAIALLVAVMFGALWLKRRDATSRLLALTAASWILASTMGLVEIVPAELRTGVHLAAMTGLAAFAALLALSLLHLCAVTRLAWSGLIWVFAAAGPVLSMLTGTRADPYLAGSWQPGLMLLIAAATGVGLYRRTRGQESPKALVLLAAVVLVLAAAIDFANVVGRDTLDGVHLLDFAGPLMLLALATPVIEGFVQGVHEAEAARVELETRVREREQLLKRNYERLREGERVKVEAQERQRIMQDMHDGLGSQLMSSLMLVERGAVSNDQFAQILRESIDDMRLAIDALAADDADLAAALGNLRFRMEPRLRAAGMELTWDARRLPEELGLHPDVVLPILRIVQEALTNALKHSRARAVRVTLATEGTGDAQSLDIRIADNGKGIGEERTGGRGLLNMRNRAQKIGAQLRIETAVNVGTTVHLRTRIEPAPPGVKASQTILNTQAIIEHVRQGT